jgi:hypothetical protein
VAVLRFERLKTFIWWKKPVESLLALPILCGLFSYAYVTQFQGLNPFEVDWLLTYWKGTVDSAQHYLGWEFFRQAPLLQWPPGKSPNLGPIGGSGVGLTDSLPLFAFIFKPLTFWFSRPFQYFGIWVLTCFVLQAVFAWKLLTIWIKHWEHALFGTFFFCFAPVFLDRIIMHMALAGHWIILASLFLLFKGEFKFKQWLLLGVIAALVQPYLAIISAVLFLAALSINYLRCKEVIQYLKHLFIYCISLLVSVWATGLFAFGVSQIQASGFGDYSANLLSLVDPGYPAGERYPWSQFIPNPWQGDNQYEGFNFVGTGVIVLSAVVLFLQFFRGRPISKILQICAIATLISSSTIFGPDKLLSLGLLGLVFAVILGLLIADNQKVRKEFVVVMVFFSAFFLVVLSNKIFVGDYYVGNVPMPPFILQLFSIVRASGRMVWPITFLVIAISIILTSRFLGRTVASVALVCAIGLQAYDSVAAVGVSKSMFAREDAPNFLVAPLWKDIKKRYTNISIVFPNDFPILQPSNKDFWAADYSVLWKELGVFAVNNKMSMNAFYFSREAVIKNATASAELRKVLYSGKLDQKTLYVFINSHYWNLMKSTHKKGDLIGILDTVPILAPGLSDCSQCDLTGFVPKSDKIIG